MEEPLTVIMLKDPKTGFLEKELGSYILSEAEGCLYHIFAEQTTSFGIVITLFLTTAYDVEDWEFNAIFDAYQWASPLPPFFLSCEEEEGRSNPMWKITISYSSNAEEMQRHLNQVLDRHKEELAKACRIALEKKDDYIDDKKE